MFQQKTNKIGVLRIILKEINELFPEASNYFKRNQLLVREEEHKQYYAYMNSYLNTVTTLPYKIIQPSIDQSILDYCVV